MFWFRNSRLARETKPHAIKRTRRQLQAERLETRRLLVAEGAVFTLPAQTIEKIGFDGNLAAEIDWGDGTSSTVNVTDFVGASNINVRFDYSLDTSNFFTGARRAVLQDVADSLVQYFNDQFTAITPSGSNTWDPLVCHPSVGSPNQLCASFVSVKNQLPRVAAGELVIFAGARDLAGTTRALAGPGAASYSGTAAWANTVLGRGQSGATTNPRTDFATWGGSLTVDNNGTDWYFGRDANGIQAGQTDFATIMAHELLHVFGFGFEPTDRTSSWERLTSGSRFVGAQATAAYPLAGNPPLQVSGATRQHWDSSLEDNGILTLMRSNLSNSERQMLTRLDLAALDDIGWQVTYPPTARITDTHVYPDDGDYEVNIYFRGSEAGQINRTLTATVTNVNPTLSVPSNQSVVAGQTLSLPADAFMISDPGFRNTAGSPATNETFTYTINWDDGSADSTGQATLTQSGSSSSPTQARFTGSHTYTETGNYTVRVTVEDDDGGSASRTFVVTVGDPPQLSLALSQTTVSEDAGANATSLTISRSGSTTDALLVSLLSSDTSEASVVASVTIPANQSSITVPVAAVDDTLLDGLQTTLLTATATGLTQQGIELSVTDAESLIVTGIRYSIRENSLPDVVARVARSNTDRSQPLDVSVTGGDSGQATVEVEGIDANQAEALVRLTPVDDAIAENLRTLTYTFQAAGYASDTFQMELLDDERAYFQNLTDRFDVDQLGTVTALDALLVINELGRFGGVSALPPFGTQPASVQRGPYRYDVNGDYLVTALDALEVINELAVRRANASANTEGEGIAPAAIAASSAFPISESRRDEDESDWLQLLAADSTRF